jgi:murein DD-endopeptidase MepM/ murein hydrolase activator NlpD
MALKHHTIIFVPHARARLRKWRVTNLQLGVFAGGFVMATLAGLLISWSYFTTTIDRDQLDALRQENLDLKQVHASFEDSITGLKAKLSEYEERTRKLAILAGLETLNAGSEVGIGGGRELPEDFEALNVLEERASSLDGTLDQVRERLDERARWISSMPTITPVRGITTSAYGVRRDPISGGRAFHQGIDISAAPRAPVRASAAGIVIQSGWSGGLGKAVYISHGYGLNTRYGHLADIAVEEGQRVKRGDIIGYVGNTGRSTGYHLHYEVRQDGKPANPMGYILD